MVILIFKKAGDSFAPPVVAVAHTFELLCHVGDIRERPVVRLSFVLYGGFFCGHTERVKADSVEYVFAVFPEEAC